MGNTTTALSKVSYESGSGLTVNLDFDTVRKYLTKGNGKVSDGEITLFMQTCAARKLNPFENGEAHLVKYGESPAQVIVGYQTYMERAETFPDYRGFKAGITVLRGKEIVQKEGACVYKALDEKLIGGWCRVFRERKQGFVEEFFAEVALDEYTTGKSKWASSPAMMIRKCAITTAFRNAYPKDFSGLYIAEEMSDVIPEDSFTPVVPSGTTNAPEVRESAPIGVNDINNAEAENASESVSELVEDRIVTETERKQMFAMAKKVFGNEANDKLKALIAKKGYENTKQLKSMDYLMVMSELQGLAG